MALGKPSMLKEQSWEETEKELPGRQEGNQERSLRRGWERANFMRTEGPPAPGWIKMSLESGQWLQ